MERVDYESLIIQDLLNFHESKSLNISPWYQRRSVWKTTQQAYLINTIFEKKPVPSLYIRHHIDLDREQSIKEVVDGQQRIRAILSYRAGEFAARHPERGRTAYNDLTPTQRREFLSTKLSVGYLIGADDRDVVEIFGRINSVMKTLNPQEKRNAEFSGEFKQFCLRQAAARLSFWRTTKLFSGTDISRMQEVQFTSDLVVNMIQGMSDFSPALMNKYYKEYDLEFPHEDEISRRLDRLFEKMALVPPDKFSDTIFSSVEVALTLMLTLDEIGPASVDIDTIVSAIDEVDAKVSAFGELEELGDQETLYLTAFTGGNLHRIRKRQPRHDILLGLLA
jgi:hypothetical protein